METIYQVKGGNFEEVYKNKGNEKSMIGLGMLYSIAAMHMGENGMILERQWDYPHMVQQSRHIF
ncbi:MAG: hypothetical protein CM15mP90_5900 [Actinomycetota bacterium]|nr:MAG: hypothetical protein CM15mP90_5900 [Actinomycetota bacterium]